jgi:hypothetical protein
LRRRCLVLRFRFRNFSNLRSQEMVRNSVESRLEHSQTQLLKANMFTA